MDFVAGVYLSEAQNPIPTPPPLTHCIRAMSCIQYTYSHRKGGGLNQREGLTVHKAGLKMPILLTVSPVYKP